MGTMNGINAGARLDRLPIGSFHHRVLQGFSVVSSLWFFGLMGVGAPLGGLLGALIADRFGRRPSLIGLALTEAALGVLYPNVGSGAELVVVGFALTLCAYAIPACGFALYIPEQFPTRLRLRGVSVATGTGRLTSSMVGFVIVSIFGAFGIEGVATFLVGSLLLLAAAVFVMGRETSNLSLEALAERVDPPLRSVDAQLASQ